MDAPTQGASTARPSDLSLVQYTYLNLKLDRVHSDIYGVRLFYLQSLVGLMNDINVWLSKTPAFAFGTMCDGNWVPGVASPTTKTTTKMCTQTQDAQFVTVQKYLSLSSDRLHVMEVQVLRAGTCTLHVASHGSCSALQRPDGHACPGAPRTHARTPLRACRMQLKMLHVLALNA